MYCHPGRVQDSRVFEAMRAVSTSQEHRHVRVMATGVHLARVGALVRHIHIFLHAESWQAHRCTQRLMLMTGKEALQVAVLLLNIYPLSFGGNNRLHQRGQHPLGPHLNGQRIHISPKRKLWGPLPDSGKDPCLCHWMLVRNAQLVQLTPAP